MATEIPKNRARFDLADIARITGGRLLGTARNVRGITTDSRGVLPDELFVALRGESFDGHRFVEQAMRQGAGAALVTDPSALPPDASGVVVPDTLEALGALAREHRRRWGGRVIGITGSAGKTTTKELLRGALEEAGLSVHATRGNLNNRVGVPMTIFELEDGHQVAVVEMGTSESGEIERLAAIAEPDVGLITSVGLSHAAGLGDVEAVAHEKGALFRALGDRGIAVVNLDDPRVTAQAKDRPLRVSYGSREDADFRLVEANLDDSGAGIRVNRREGGATIAARLSMPSHVAALNAAGVLAAVRALGHEPEKAAPGLASVLGEAGRMRPFRLENGALVLDDTYNANPRSVASSMESAAHLAAQRGGRLIVALGSMKELGPHSEQAHAEIGALAARLSVSRLVGVGTEMVAAIDQAARGGVAVAWVPDSDSAAAEIGPVAAADVILVKGSRSTRMERVVAELRAPERTP